VTIEVLLRFQDPDLEEEDLQVEVEQLLPQLRDIDGVGSVELLSAEQVPMGAKAFGGVILGAVKFLVDNSNILQGTVWVGERLISGRSMKMVVKAPNGSEFTGEAKSREDLEYLLQKAIEFCEKNQ
jgi:hypothetical protein